ncbi:MAG: hypothetical protein V8R80_11015 [Eubacterium sp.]
MSDTGREFIRELNPERVFIYHLPFEEDDTYCTYAACNSALKCYPDDLPKIEVMKHMAWIE